MQYDLYILVYFDGGHPKLFYLAPPLYILNCILVVICQHIL